MILSAQSIRERVGMITPLWERTKYEGMTYGIGPCGYDVRVDAEYTIFTSGFVLAATFEKFSMPHDVVAQVCDKSSWARRGIAVQNTIIEPGWRGYLTLELTNHSNSPVTIPCLAPIAQIIFMRLDRPTSQPYDGKYQDQQAGPQPAR